MRPLLRVLMVLFAFTWWLLPAMGVIDLSVTWDPGWPVILEAGWGVLFTGVGLSFLLAGVAARLTEAALLHTYVTSGVLVVAALVSQEPETWWIFAMLLIQVALLRLLAGGVPVGGAPYLPLAILAAVAAPVGLTYAWQMAAKNRQSIPHGDITNGVDHFSVQAALGLLLVALPLAGALRSSTRRLLGTITSLMAGYLGLLSYHWPGELGGFDAGWSIAVMVWAGAVLVAAWWPAVGSLRRPAT